MKRRQQAVLAIDRMRRGQQLPERLAAQHEIARRRADAIGRVRLSRRELAELERRLETFDVRFKPAAERSLVDRLLGHLCFLYSRRAIARRCPSSGPSA